MSKKERPHQPKIHSETKNSLIAVLLAGIAVILVLAAVDKAGPVGRFVYLILQNLFGWGYYLLPTIAALIAFLFLVARQKVFVTTSFLGAKMNHTGVTTGCATCHDGTTAKGKSGSHITTSAA